MAEEEIDNVTSSVSALSERGPDLGDAPRYADPRLDALSVIGSDLGMPLRPAHAQIEHARAPLAADAASSGWLSWPVALTGRWRGGLAMPLYVERSGAPAAILCRRGDALLIDGATRSVEPLTKSVAAEVDVEAVAFVPDLPPSERWTDLVRWGLRGQGTDVWVFFLLAALGGVAGLALPVATSLIFQWAIPSGDLPLALTLLVAFGVVSLGTAVLALAYGRLVVRIRDRMDLLLGQAVMARLLRVRVSFFRQHSVGDVSNRAMSITSARTQVSDLVLISVVMAAFGLTSLLYLFTAGFLLGLLTALTVAMVLAGSLWTQARARRVLPRLLERRSRTDATVLSLLSSLVSWKVTASESRALRLWADRQRGSTRAFGQRLSAVAWGATIDRAGPAVVLAAFTLLVVIVPTQALDPGSASAPGVFLALYAAVVQVTMAMLALGANAFTLSEYGPILDRIRPIVTAPVEGALAGPHPGPLHGRVALKGITFGYIEGRAPLFEGLSLDVAPGEFVAVVGPSGSGKSTLLRLLLGFEEPWMGFVSYDGRDLAGLDAAAVRRQMGVVLQSSQPLGRTIRQCVTVGKHFSDDQVWDLLAEAGMVDDVRAMPQGLDTQVGEGGASLSGGQRQRIMVAAALADNPAIMLFDEATSALDNVSQAVVMRTVLASSATRIVIAHRLSTVERADRVVVVANGTIAEEGSPDELLRADGLFARLASRQIT